MTNKNNNEFSPIRQIQEEKEHSSKASQSSSLSYIAVSKPIIIISGILFLGMLIAVISLSINQVSVKNYSKIGNIEELILAGDFSKAEELCYGFLYSDNQLAGYSEGALLRIAGEYAALGDHKKSKVVLERVLSSNPTSFVGRTSLVVTSTLSGDIVGAIKSIADIPNVTSYIPGIHTIIKKLTVGNITDSKGMIESIIKMLLTQS